MCNIHALFICYLSLIGKFECVHSFAITGLILIAVAQQWLPPHNGQKSLVVWWNVNVSAHRGANMVELNFKPQLMSPLYVDSFNSVWSPTVTYYALSAWAYIFRKKFIFYVIAFYSRIRCARMPVILSVLWVVSGNQCDSSRLSFSSVKEKEKGNHVSYKYA